MTEFFRVITSDRFLELLGGFPRLEEETVALDESLGQILSRDLISNEDLPEGARSTVDGYAVRASDTFGASDSIPAFLELAEPVHMGAMPEFQLRAGQAAPIPTGGFLPGGADAVVMVEYTNVAGPGSIEVSRPVTTKANVLEKGADARSGEALLAAGKMLRPQELGFLAALGITKIHTRRRPRVAVISSGDEVIPMEQKPRPGQIRDANSHAISALIRGAGAQPFPSDIVPDDAGRLRHALQKALEENDVVTLSGGSSVGARDLMMETVAALPGAEVLAHGLSIRPGKPTLLARQRDRAIIGLPGHPVSALVIAQIFLEPFLRYLRGFGLAKGPIGIPLRASLATSIHSVIGLEEYVRVHIEKCDAITSLAHPVFGKSGMLSTLTRADGILRVPMNTEGLPKGADVEIIQYSIL